jgi:hypothetical protein
MNSVNQEKYPNITVIDLTKNEDKAEIYIQKDYRNLTLKEDGIEFVKIQRCCPGCFPVFQCNQLAHMDYGGCLYSEDD